MQTKSSWKLRGTIVLLPMTWETVGHFWLWSNTSHHTTVLPCANNQETTVMMTTAVSSLSLVFQPLAFWPSWVWFDFCTEQHGAGLWLRAAGRGGLSPHTRVQHPRRVCGVCRPVVAHGSHFRCAPCHFLIARWLPGCSVPFYIGAFNGFHTEKLQLSMCSSTGFPLIDLGR